MPKDPKITSAVKPKPKVREKARPHTAGRSVCSACGEYMRRRGAQRHCTFCGWGFTRDRK